MNIKKKAENDGKGRYNGRKKSKKCLNKKKWKKKIEKIKRETAKNEKKEKNVKN